MAGPDLRAEPQRWVRDCTELSLKGGSEQSDTGTMIFSARPVPNRNAVALCRVRRSLNTPVVAISELPVGPATAAIAVHEGARAGKPHLTLAVRCERTRGVVFFAAQEIADAADSAHAADAALSFAEGMGFLFDEDWVDAAVPAVGADAEQIWEEFAAGADPSPVGSDPAGPELLLTKFRRALPWNPQQSQWSDRPSAPPIGGRAGCGG